MASLHYRITKYIPLPTLLGAVWWYVWRADEELCEPLSADTPTQLANQLSEKTTMPDGGGNDSYEDTKSGPELTVLH